VRGIVASVLGYKYIGIDLSEAQIVANVKQGATITPNNTPVWISGNSFAMESLLPADTKYDFIFSCPPYHDLEKYSDLVDDLSNMSWDSFKRQYDDIIGKAVHRLKDNRFACFIVSEIRDKKGYFKGLVPLTIECFRHNGMQYYNEIILVNSVGSLPVRIHGAFRNRKIGRTHQNLLIFYKGDTSLIKSHYNDISSSFGGTFK